MKIKFEYIICGMVFVIINTFMFLIYNYHMTELKLRYPQPQPQVEKR
jgi:hypothetical protein